MTRVQQVLALRPDLRQTLQRYPGLVRFLEIQDGAVVLGNDRGSLPEEVLEDVLPLFPAAPAKKRCQEKFPMLFREQAYKNVQSFLNQEQSAKLHSTGRAMAQNKDKRSAHILGFVRGFQLLVSYL